MSVFKRKLGDLKRKLGVNGVEDPESSVSRAPPLKKTYKPFTLGSRINPSPSTESSKHPKSSGQPETGPATGVPPTSCDMSAIGVKPTQKGAETGKEFAHPKAQECNGARKGFQW
ncbi:hypothetical protein RSAG8_10674, partial [Rhizoctonia solani AG-8 WAC10335]